MTERARGQVPLGDGTLVWGTCVSVVLGGEYVTLLLDDEDGRHDHIDGGSRCCTTRRDRVQWAP